VLCKSLFKEKSLFLSYC